MDIRKKIGLRLKELRLQQHLTQEALAYKAEVDKTYLNEVENGKRNISVINLEKVIAKGLQLSIHQFFDSIYFKES